MQYFMPSGEIDTNDVMIIVIFSNTFFGNRCTFNILRMRRMVNELLEGVGLAFT